MKHFVSMVHIIFSSQGALSFYTGRTITLQGFKHVTRGLLQRITTKKPLILKIVDCKGTLETSDVVNFVEEMGQLQVKLKCSSFADK